MSRVVAHLRSGDWLTPSRLTVYPMLLLAIVVVAIIAIAATAHGLLDAWGRPLGTDFSQIWVAGGEVAAGRAADVYDNARHVLAQEKVFGPSAAFYTWPYPPYFLFVAALCGLLPYLPALLAWQALTLPLYLGAVWRLVAGTALPRRATLVAAAAFPAVMINVLHGHNGFLTTGLLAWGVIVLPRRPMLAGALFALLAYKPQFALALPVALLAGGAWRCLLAAAASFVAFTVATLVAFGAEPWRAFWAGTGFTRTVVLEAGAIGFEKIQTTFAAVRLLGGSVAFAYGAQTLVTAAVLVSLAWLWRSCREPALCAAALLAATVLTTPYALDYDEIVLGPALALVAVHGTQHGFAPFEKSILALTWIMPLMARTLGALGLPLGPLVTVLFYAVIVARGVRAHQIHAGPARKAGDHKALLA